MWHFCMELWHFLFSLLVNNTTMILVTSSLLNPSHPRMTSCLTPCPIYLFIYFISNNNYWGEQGICPEWDFKQLTKERTGRRPIGKSKAYWKYNIEMDLEVIGVSVGNWIDSTQDRYDCRMDIGINLKVSIRGIGLFRLRIRIIGEPLSMQHWTSGFHKSWS